MQENDAITLSKRRRYIKTCVDKKTIKSFYQLLPVLLFFLGGWALHNEHTLSAEPAMLRDTSTRDEPAIFIFALMPNAKVPERMNESRFVNSIFDMCFKFRG